MWFSSVLINLNSNIWKNPKTFDPTRFLEKEASPLQTPTFGYGTRSCIGKQFAVNEAAAVLTMIYQNFTVEFPEGISGYEPEKFATARAPKGQTAPMILTRRLIADSRN